MAGSNEHIIKIQSYTDNNNTSSGNDFDISAISSAIESTLNSSMKSMENTIGSAINKALSNVFSKDSKESKDNTAFSNTLAKDIKEAIVAVITKSASSDTPVNSKDVQKDVTASIKTVLSSQLQGYFKANKISNETSSTNAIVKSVSSSISKQESADIAKIVQAFAAISKDLSHIPALIDALNKEKVKDVPDVSKITSLVENITSKATNVKDNYKVIRTPINRVDVDKSTGAVDTLSGINKALTSVIKSVKEFFNKEVTIKVSADTSKAEKDIKGLATKESTIVVNADTSKVDNKISKLLEQDVLTLSIDLEKDEIPDIYNRINNLKNKINELNDKGISLGIDTKALQELQSRLTKLVQGFDYVKGSLGREQYNRISELNKLPSRDEAVKLPASSRSGIEAQRDRLEKRIAELEATRVSMNSVVDRKESSYITNDSTKKSDVLTIEHDFAKLGKIPDIKAALSNENLKTFVKSDRGASTLQDLSSLEALIKEFNNTVAKLSVDKAPQDTTKLVQAIDKNTTALEQNKLASVVDKFKAEASKSQYALANAEKAIGIKYSERFIHPTESYTAPDKVSNEYELKVYDNMSKLASSLDRLQKTLYTRVSEGLKPQPGKRQYTDWKVVENEGTGNVHNRAFNLRGKDWAMDIVDMKKLRSLTGQQEGTPKELLKLYTDKVSTNLLREKGHTPSSLKLELADWLKSNIKSSGVQGLSSDVKDTLGKDVLEQLNVPNISNYSTEDISKVFDKASKESLKNIYNKTVGFSKIEESLADVKRTIAIPAAKLTNTGSTVLETQHGSQRSTLQLAEYKSGHERAFEGYIKNLESMFNKVPKNQQDSVKSVITPEILTLSKAVRSFDFSKSERDVVPETKVTYEEASKLLLKGVTSKDGTFSKESAADIYRKSLVPISIEKQRLTKGTSNEISAKEEYLSLAKQLDQAFKSTKTIDDFMEAMSSLGISATKAIKSLDSLNFSNVYDTIERATEPKIGKIVDNIATSSGAIGDFEKTIASLEGMMPIVEKNAPRRGMHQGDTVSAVFNYSKAFDLNNSTSKLLTDEGKERFEGSLNKEAREFGSNNEAKKSFITNFNRRANELFYEASNIPDMEGVAKEASYRKALLNTNNNKQLTSLGLPESPASNLDFTTSALNRSGLTVPMYTGNLREIAPFSLEYQQTGRNISGISSAKSFDTGLFGKSQGISSEFPKLRSESEDKVIQAGRFGKSGIGYNVLAELRHTAGTFEDQILVSGKLADAATTAVRKLVRPKASAGKASAINEGPLKDSDIEEVSGNIMSIMGIDEKYKRRPDKAFIENVRNEVSTNRGASLEVQTAKLAELFFNHFGRKLTTRYGSKGVSVTPTSPSTLGDILAQNQGHSVKVLTEEAQKKAGLGVAFMPKSMGDLSADILNQQSDITKNKISSDTGINVDELAKELKDSGNKFILDIFTDVSKGLVTEEEAIKNLAVFDKAKKAFASLDINLEKNIKGIETIRGAHTGEKTIAKAIDVRISSYGAAKRGLQTEPLEIIANNLAGSSDKTVLKNTIDDKNTGLISGKSGGLFSKYSKALGFSGAGKTDEELYKQISSMYSEDKLKDKSVQEAIKAMVELEKKSNYYVEVVDELNKRRKSLVGEKFLSIVEEPTQTEEWSKGAIDSLSKGIKLNIPAYAAYTSVFGEDSAFMKSINENFTDKQAEHYDNILTYLVNNNEEYKKNVLSSISSVDLKDLKAVNKDAVKTFNEGDPGSLLGTIFDTDAFPKAYKTTIPSTVGKDEAGEELYIPRSISRTTYADPMRAGAYGIKKTGSKLQDVIDKSRSLKAFYEKDPEYLLETDITGMSGAFGSTTAKALESFFEKDTFGRSTGVEQADTEEAVNKLNQIKKDLLDLLLKFKDQGVLSEDSGSLNKTIQNFYNSKKNPVAKFDLQDASESSFVKHLSTPEGFNSPTALAAMKNLLIGTGKANEADTSVLAKATDTKTKLSVMQGITRAIGDEGSMFSYGIGSSAEEKYNNQVKKRQEDLEKAKADYELSLKNTLVGKKGSVARTFFTRNIPSVLAKATNATVDKTEDLTMFSENLKNISGLDLTAEISKIEALTSEHAANVSKYKEIGMPVLKQHELGVSEKMAEKLKVDFTKKYNENSGMPLGKLQGETSGSLKDLLTYSDKLKETANKHVDPKLKEEIINYIETELAPYVESVRFPFTGTSSIKPYKAKLMQIPGGIGDDSLIVPGAPEMDMGKFEEVYNSIKDKIKALSSERENYRVAGDDVKADSLTATIDKLNEAISAVLPKYVAHAQKLDFDGDQIELHTAKTSEARNDIYKHFKMLTTDIDSTAGKFGDYYAYDAKQPSQGDLPLSFMSKAFSKKFDSSKGYSFLDKPFTTEDLSYLTPKEKIGILASKEQDLNMTSGGESVSRVMRAIYEKVGGKFDDSTIRNIEDLGEAAEAAVAQITQIKDIKLKSFIEGNIKEELSNVKLDTAVNAQLFKINTGTDTESMTRLMRAYESKIGYDESGEINYAASKDSGKLDQAFITRERNTQLNEFFRFAIQKGMDVKHAGERPIAGELVKGVTTGNAGLYTLLQNLEKNKSYDDLKTFKNINEESLRNTFGKFSTKDLKEQVVASGVTQKDVTDMPREELINALVKKLGFEGFLVDLQKSIEQLAVQGIKAKSEKPISDEYAYKILQKKYESKNGAPPKGIDVTSLITDVKDPLYKFRTDGAKVDTGFDAEFEKAFSSIKDTYKGKGAYSELVRSFDSLNKDAVDKSTFDAASSLLLKTPKDSFITGETSMGPIKDLIGSMENTLGLAPLSERKQASILTSPEYVANLQDISNVSDEKEKAKLERANERLSNFELLKARLERIESLATFTEAPVRPVRPDISLSTTREAVTRSSIGAPKATESSVDLQNIKVAENVTVPQASSSIAASSNVPPSPPKPPVIEGDLSNKSGGVVSVYLEGMNSGLIFPVKLMGQLLDAANVVSSSPQSFEGFKSEESNIPNINQTVDKFKTTEEQRKNAAARAQTLEPYEGHGPTTELANLKLLRDASKSLYEARGMDFNNEAKKLTQEAQDYISSAKDVGGVDVSEFLKYTQNARILNQQDENQGMSGKDISTAWRLYKDAVVEYLIKKAEAAEEVYQSVAGQGGREEATAYDKFATAVNSVQKRIIADTGKRSDIYTANKVWAFPDIAKAAGVYQSPIDIQRKSNRDLGADDDPDSDLLRRVFDNITNDLSGKSRGEITAPQDKARSAIKELTEMNEETVALMNNGRLLERLGPEIAEAWDFKAAAERITRLRSALELFKQFNVSDSPLSVEKKNLEDTIKLLKDAENKLSKADMGKKTQVGGSGVWGETGVVQVPKWADPEMQLNMHRRNLSKLREYYAKPESEGGAKIGERYAYDTKVFDDVGKPIENQRTLFHKFSETVDSAGQTVGLFSAKQEDLAASLAGANRGFLGAIERAVKWGAASTLIYGGVSQLKEAVDTVAEIETGMAQLKMVMPSVGTDFEGMQQSASTMAKKYGAPTTGVLDAMVVYAQQGLSQADVIERTETSMLAGNVTTLNAKEATEALTAAMKVFREEGENSIRFLDSWSEVEAKHAITSGDMAQAIMKAAAAASTAGINFDQLNGIVAAIGSVTRQSGKEVGTSLRFIMRRLSAEKGPDYLAKLNIPTITGEGELRGGFDILSNLAEKWKELHSAQKMAVAQAIGGTRQYNSLLVLMDNWQEALDGVHHSMNAQGSAARRNAEIMQTYSKQVEQTKASFVELQTAFGKIAFPVAKFGLQSMKTLAETISAIPTSFKVASVAALGLFTYLSQGAKVLDSISDFFSGGTPIMGGLITSIKDELKTASFEILGAGSLDTSTKGLKTLVSDKVEGREQGKGLRDFESSLGKAAYLLVSAGKAFNDTVGGGLQGTGKAGQAFGQATVRGSSWLSSIVSALGGGKYGKEEDVTYKDLAGGVASKYTKSESIKGAFALGGMKGLGKIASSFAGVATEVAGLGGAAAGIFVDEFSKKLGAGGDMFKSWAADNAGVVKAVAPMLLTVGLLTPALKALGSEFVNTTKSSLDFADAMYGLVEKDETALAQIRDTKKSYSDLQKKVKDINTSENPENKARQKYLGTYVHPFTALADVQSQTLSLGDSIAKSNVNMITGYDNLGNAILRTADNYKVLLDTFERSKIRDIASKDSQVVAKHIEALTKTDGAEGWKSELKDLTKEIPVIGEMISNQISVSPAKSLEILTGKLNNLVSRKNASPMSTIYDDDITNLQSKLSKVKDSFNHTYSEFKRSLSEIPTAGLGRDEIAGILGADELKAGYKLMLEVEPEFNVKGVKEKITQEDVLGAEVMRRIFPENSFLGATKELSSANIESKGLSARQGKLLSGDLVTFTDDVAEKFNMSGRQAIVKLKETSDGIFEWVATYFNTKTLKIEDRKFDGNLQNLVESILPSKAIEQDMSERIEALGTFITGASAGLTGIAKKGFKADFNLGERFFSDISTSTIIQGDKGFNPLEGFGESKLQKGWADDFEKYYNKPLHEYKTSLEELEKMHLDGLDTGSVEMSTGLYESLLKLQNVLKNNQVVLQYRAVFADLTKTIEANTRAVKENLAIEKTRATLTKETGGLLKGYDTSLANIDLGKYNKTELTAQERLLTKSGDFSKNSERLRELDIKKSGTAEQLYSIDRAKVALESVRELSSGFGTSLSKEDLGKYTEVVAKTGDLGIAELKLDTSNTAENTAKTVDKLDDILANLEDRAGSEDMQTSFKDALDFVLPSLNLTKNERLSEALDRVASLRNEAVSSGDSETAIKANTALDSLTKQLVDRMGLEGAVSKVDSGLFGSGAFKGEELVQRAFGGLDFKTLSGEIKSKIGNESSWFGLSSKKGTPTFDKSVEDIQTLQAENKEKANDKSLFSSKNLAGLSTGFGVYQAFNTNFSNKKIEAYEKEIADLKSREAEIGPIDYAPQLFSLEAAKAEEEKKARMYGTMRFAAGGASGGMLLARNLGMSEDNIKRMGAGGAALGVYGAAKLQQGMTGDDLPQIVKDFGKEVAIFAAAMKDDGIFSTLKQGFAADRFKSASEDFMKQFAEETLDLTATPSETAKDRNEKYGNAADSFAKTKDNFMFDAEWKAKELKRTIENPNADLRSKTTDSVNQMAEDVKSKLASLKEYIKTYSQDTIKSAEDKMAGGPENNLKDEASQVFEGVKVKTKDTYEDLKSKAGDVGTFAGKTADYASEMSLGALDALIEALSKNTEAVNNSTSTDAGKALGGFVQRFADGGTVKQIMPGSGDKQPSLLTAGEEVLSVEQRKKLKPVLDALKDPNLGKKYAFGGSLNVVDPSDNDPNKTFNELGELLNIDPKYVPNAPVMYASGGSVGIVDPSSYDPEHSKKQIDKILGTVLPEDITNLLSSGTMKYAIGGIVDPNQEYNMQDITNRATETAKTVLDTVPPEVIASIDDSKFMSNIGKATLVGGTALGAGLYALNGAKKTNFNLKDTLTNTKDTFGTYYKDFNIKDHYNKMDKTIFANPFKNVGSLVEDVKGFKNLAGSGFSVGAKAAGKTALKAAGPLGTVLATGFAIKRAAEGDMLGAGLEAASAVLSGTGLGSAASLGIQAYLAKRDSDLIEESIFDEDNFAGGGIVGGLFGLAKGIANLGWLGTKGVLKGTGYVAKATGKGISSALKLADDNSSAISTGIGYGIKGLGYGLKGTYEATKLGGKGLNYGLGYVNKGLEGISTFASKSDLNKNIVQAASATTLLGTAGYLAYEDDKQNYAEGGKVVEKDVSFFGETGKGLLRGAGLAALGTGAALLGAPLLAAAAGVGLIGNGIYTNYRQLKGLFGGTDTEDVTDTYANGGFTTGLITGPGTGTSDSISMHNVPEGSFIVPSKYAQRAKEQVELAAGGMATSNIRVSNGEYFIAPEDAEKIGETNLRKLQVGQKASFANGGVIKRFAEGGSVGTPDSVVAINQESINRLAQASAAAAAFTLSRYAAEKTADTTRATDLGNMAEGENTAIYDAIMANSDAAQKVYDDLRAPQSNTNEGRAETEEVSKVLDTNVEYNKILEEQREIEKSLIAEHASYNEEMVKLKEEMHKAEIAEKFIMQIEAMNKAVSDNQLAENFKRSLKIGTGAFEGFTGPRDIDLTTKGTTDLSSMELLQVVAKRKKDQQHWYNMSTYTEPVKNFGLRMINSINPEDTYNNKYRGQNVLKEYSKLEDEKTKYTSIMNSALQNRSQATDEDEYDKWNEVLEDTKENLEEVVSKQDGYSVALKEQARATDEAMRTLNRFKEASVNLSNTRVDAYYGLGNRGMGGKLRGAISDVSLLPSGVEDLNNQQYAYMNAGTDMKGTITQYKVNTDLYNQQLQEIKTMEAEKIKRESDRFVTSDRGVLFRDNEPQRVDNDIKDLDSRLASAYSKLAAIGGSVESASLKISNFFAATDAAKQFDTALNTVKASMFSARNGAIELQNKLDNLYGGSGAFAPQFVDVNQRQEAARYGVDLELGKSNQFDIERSNLMKTLYSSTDPQTWQDARRSLSNLDQKQLDYKENTKRLQEAQTVRDSIRPGQDYLTNLSTARTKISERLMANEYTDFDAAGLSKAKGEDTAALATLDKGYKEMVAKLEAIISRGTPVTTEDFAEMRNIITETNKGVGGAAAEDLEKARGTSGNPVVDIIKTQTTELLSGLVSKSQMDEVLNILKVEKSPSTFSTIASWFSPRETGSERMGPWSEEYAAGGSVGTMIKGAGTGTSDSINMAVPAGSFIVKAKHAQATKNALNAFADGGKVPIKVSNGELLLTPEEVQKIGGTDVANAFNNGNLPSEDVILNSWTKEDFNQHGFADAVDYKQQTGGLESPMFDPIDLITGLGFSGILKALSGTATKTASKAISSTTASYIDEAKSIMGTNLDVTRYAKEIQSNDALMQAVLNKGKDIYVKTLTLPQMFVRSGPVTMKNLVEDLARTGYAAGGYVTDSGLSISGASEEDLEKFKYGRAGRLKGVARVVNGLEISGENQEEIDRFVYGRAGKPSDTLPTITSATGLEIQTASIDNFKKLVKEGDSISFPKSKTSLDLNEQLKKLTDNTESYNRINISPLTVFGTKTLKSIGNGKLEPSSVPIYGETNNTPIVSEGLDLSKIAENYKAVQSTEKIMVDKKPLVQTSDKDLSSKIAELAKLRDSNLMTAKDLLSGIEQIKFTHATTPEEQASKDSILAKLNETLAMRRSNVDYYEGALDKPTTASLVKQVDATSVGYKFNAPKRWTDIKGPVIMNLSGKGSTFMADDLNKGPDALTDLQKQLAVVGEDTPERQAYFKKIGEEKQKAFMQSLSIASRNAQTLSEAGGLKSVYTNQRANFMMAEAVQHYHKNLGGFYFEKSQADTKKLMDTKYGEGTYEKRKARKAVNWQSYNSMYSSMEDRAQRDPIFYKRYYDGLPTTPTLSPEIIELIRQLKKDKGEVITRNNDPSKSFFEGGEVNNLSRQVKHNGGVAHKSGTYFLEGGEVVIPKGFANGGNVLPESLVTRQTRNEQSIEIEGLDTFDKIVRTLEKSLDKLTNIKIEGIDKLTDIKIEGLNDLKNIQIEGLNDLKDIKIEGLADLKDIRIEGLSELKNIQIEGLENLKNIQIEGIEKLTNIRVEGLDQLHDISINGLENLRDIKILGVEELKDISVKSSSVGADTGDMLASTLKDFDSRVNNLEKNSSNQISLIKATVDEALANIPAMDMTQRSEISEIKKDLMVTSSEVSNLTSSMKRFTQEVSVTLKELNDKQNTAMTHIYSIKRS